MVAEPICTLTTFGKETVVCEGETSSTTTDDPLQVLQQVLDRADIHPAHNEDLPFQGGALGLFGYDLGRRFESLPKIAEQDGLLPGVVQVPHNGQPIVLLNDAQTTGGYPRIACIIEADMYHLAQIPLGQPIHFVKCSQSNADNA